MQERVFRYGLTGLIFLLSILFGFWYLGGNPKNSIFFNKEGLITSIVAIITTPAIGFILSSIYIEAWKCLRSRKTIFQKPSTKIAQEYYKMIHKKFKLNSGVGFEDGSYSETDYEDLLLNHQILMRESENTEAIEFSTRRVDIFYAHLNYGISILAGILFGFAVSFCTLRDINRYIDWDKLFFIIPPSIYLIVAYRQAKEALEQSNEFEKRFLLRKDKSV